MSNEFYDHLSAPQTGSSLSSAIVRSEFAKIEQGFDKFPNLSGSANKGLRVNASGSAIEATDTATINGGSINGAVIGNGIPAAGTFTDLTATSSANVPTVAADNSSTKAASTAFVLGQAGAITPIVDGTATAGTSYKYSREDHTHPTDASRAPTASPTFTGTVTVPTLSVGTAGTAPTLAVDNSSTGIATTAFDLGQAGASSPIVNGTATVGTSTRFSRQDHVHPTDTSRAPTANPTFTGTVTLGGDPASNLQAATKQYVDAVATGLDTHTECACATTANITLSGLQTIDGYTTLASDRVLVKNQTTTSQNGIYVAAPGAWARAADADTTGELKQGSYVFVNNGTANQKTGWTQQTSGTITIGSTAIVWAQFSSVINYTAGVGLSLTGTTFDVTNVPVLNGGTGSTTAAGAPFALKGANSDITSLSGITTALSVPQGGTGAATFTSGSLLKGSGTGAIAVATAANIATALGTTAVTNATNATNSGITNDTTTNATMFPVWVTANTGNLPIKVTSTKFSFNPSTGVVTASGFSGPLTGNASTASAATNLSGGVAGAVPFQSGVGASSFSAAGTVGQVLLSGGATTPTWGTLTVANGGTGATNAATARTNLGVPSSTGSGASGTSWAISITGSAGSAGTATTAGNVTGTVAVANGGTGASTSSNARTNLGLGTSAVLNSGVSVGNVVTVQTGGKLPALDASLLTNVPAGTIADNSITPAKLTQPLTSGTAQATTSGTSIDFTGIPSWVKRITLLFSAISTSGSSNVLVRLGDSGGFEVSGYVGQICTAPGTDASVFSTGFLTQAVGNSGHGRHGSLILTLLDSATNTWSCAFTIGNTLGTVYVGGGTKALSGVLTQVRLTTVNGTDTFDAGLVNILYE